MADDGSKASTTCPKPKFRFEVDFGNGQKNVMFQEISGMDLENQIPEYTTDKMPGIVK